MSRAEKAIKSSIRSNISAMIAKRFEFGNERYGIRPNRQNDGLPTLVETGRLRSAMAKRPTVVRKPPGFVVVWRGVPTYAEQLIVYKKQDFLKLTDNEVRSILKSALSLITPPAT